jgi:hypothetical protein
MKIIKAILHLIFEINLALMTGIFWVLIIIVIRWLYLKLFKKIDIKNIFSAKKWMKKAGLAFMISFIFAFILAFIYYFLTGRSIT